MPRPKTVPPGVCARCREPKAEAEFIVDRRKPSGRGSWCIECNRAYQRAHAAKKRSTPEGRVAALHAVRRYQERNPERVRAASRASARRSVEQNPGFYREQAARHPGRTAARQAVRNAIRRGELVKPNHCTRCRNAVQARFLQAHHADYGIPLDVEWLCARCHGREHRETA